ncbi:hypothetical protein N7G274_001899 [Stereocaulon virgatum]|uniref:Xylulose 5-phosphate/Fructose 6-phosphate phosphoketolase C-terminal domain-containing protein n=1 Tax=Stereocaulon virgatum TaxID=373712 RepID=A0ABR4AKU1_9LECA
MVLGLEFSHPHSLSHEGFDNFFTPEQHIHFSYHGGYGRSTPRDTEPRNHFGQLLQRLSHNPHLRGHSAIQRDSTPVSPGLQVVISQREPLLGSTFEEVPRPTSPGNFGTMRTLMNINHHGFVYINAHCTPSSMMVVVVAQKMRIDSRDRTVLE